MGQPPYRWITLSICRRKVTVSHIPVSTWRDFCASPAVSFAPFRCSPLLLRAENQVLHIWYPANLNSKIPAVTCSK